MEREEVRIKQKTYDELAELAKQQGRSVEELVDQALAEFIKANS